MFQMNGTTLRLSGCSLLVCCATALAQQPDGFSFDADSVSLDLRGRGRVFTGLTVTDGTITIDAAEATTTGDSSDAWELRNGLRITIDVVTLIADSGTLRVADGEITAIELLGDPVTLDGPVGGEPRQLRVTAGRIAYDGMLRVLTASDGAVFVSDGLEVKNCNWTYDLSDQSVHATAETSSKCRATAAVNRAPRE